MKPATPLRAWSLIGLGLFLILGMGAIALSLAPAMLRPGETTAGGGTFMGTPEQATLFLRLFALVFAIGVLSTIYGVFQLVTRRQSLLFIAFSLLLAIATAWLAVSILSGK